MRLAQAAQAVFIIGSWRQLPALQSPPKKAGLPPALTLQIILEAPLLPASYVGAVAGGYRSTPRAALG